VLLKPSTRYIISLIIIAGFLGVACRNIDWHSFLDSLLAANVIMIISMMIVWCSLLAIRPARLLLLVRALEANEPCSYFTMVSANIIATAANNLFPARAGDIVLPLILRNSASARARYVVPALVLDRIMDTVGALATFFVSATVVPSIPSWAISVSEFALVILCSCLIAFAVIVHLRLKVLLIVTTCLSKIRPRSRDKWIVILADSLNGIAAAVRAGWMVWAALGLTILMWIMIVVFYLFGIWAVWPEGSFASAAFMAGAVTLSFLIPLTPGGIGVFHAAAVLALTLFMVPPELGLAIAAITHGLPFISIFVIASIVAIKRPKEPLNKSSDWVSCTL
jgi:hypothetical protein